MIASDLLISDYSSTILDYSILEKPIICFGYDFEEYSAQRGFYFDMETVMPGGVVRNEDALLSRIKTIDWESERAEAKKLKDEHMEYGGNATLLCIDAVFGTDYSKK
jgi:CDP-glycerol glycerophosphotransferase